MLGSLPVDGRLGPAPTTVTLLDCLPQPRTPVECLYTVVHSVGDVGLYIHIIYTNVLCCKTRASVPNMEIVMFSIWNRSIETGPSSELETVTVIKENRTVIRFL